jgi:large subunit ribosomal protein L30
MSARLRVRLRKSPISYTQATHGTLRALGLRRINDTVEVPDNPATRGMVRAVRFLVEVEEVGTPERARAHGSKAAHAPATGEETT